MFSDTAQVSHQVCEFFCQFLSVPWDNAIVVSAGKLRKLWDSLSELRSSVWKTTGKDSSEACAFVCQNCAVYSVFPSGMTSYSQFAQFNWECIGRFTVHSKDSIGTTDHVTLYTRWRITPCRYKRVLSVVRECGHCRPGLVQFEWLHSQKCTGHDLSCWPHADSCCKKTNIIK
jgi:hypothetical protein